MLNIQVKSMRSSTSFISTCRPIAIPACRLKSSSDSHADPQTPKHVVEEFTAICMPAAFRGGMCKKEFLLSTCLLQATAACGPAPSANSHADSQIPKHVVEEFTAIRMSAVFRGSMCKKELLLSACLAQATAA